MHKKPDEFPPKEELDRKGYHYLCPKVRMPVNVFFITYTERGGKYGESIPRILGFNVYLRS
jgi:hypothetical protein